MNVVQQVNHNKYLSVQDIDGDDVRCRWAVGNECGSVCQAFPAILDMVNLLSAHSDSYMLYMHIAQNKSVWEYIIITLVITDLVHQDDDSYPHCFHAVYSSLLCQLFEPWLVCSCFAD